MKNLLVAAIAILALASCKAFTGSPPESPPTTVDTSEFVDATKSTAGMTMASSVATTDEERALLVRACASEEKENPAYCACSVKAAEDHLTQSAWDALIKGAIDGKTEPEKVDYDALSEAEQDRMMALIGATAACHPKSNTAIIVNSCTEDGNSEQYCGCMADGMADLFSTSTYLKSASAMSRGEGMASFLSSATPAERAEVEKMETMSKACKFYGYWQGADRLDDAVFAQDLAMFNACKANGGDDARCTCTTTVLRDSLNPMLFDKTAKALIANTDMEAWFNALPADEQAAYNSGYADAGAICP